jgi:hypothetical protein
MKNRPVGDRSSETQSHRIDMNNNNSVFFPHSELMTLRTNGCYLPLTELNIYLYNGEVLHTLSFNVYKMDERVMPGNLLTK